MNVEKLMRIICKSYLIFTAYVLLTINKWGWNDTQYKDFTFVFLMGFAIVIMILPQIRFSSEFKENEDSQGMEEKAN